VIKFNCVGWKSEAPSGKPLTSAYAVDYKNYFRIVCWVALQSWSCLVAPVAYQAYVKENQTI
jgi:hypothetical protein